MLRSGANAFWCSPRIESEGSNRGLCMHISLLRMQQICSFLSPSSDKLLRITQFSRLLLHSLPGNSCKNTWFFLGSQSVSQSSYHCGELFWADSNLVVIFHDSPSNITVSGGAILVQYELLKTSFATD
jgi:hypothetical protein